MGLKDKIINDLMILTTGVDLLICRLTANVINQAGAIPKGSLEVADFLLYNYGTVKFSGRSSVRPERWLRGALA